MKNLIYILITVSIFASCQNKTEETTTSNKENLPNIILLIGDDQGYPYFGFMGADYVHTPNMDSLVANGILFTDGYVSDNHCRPSLQTLLTGILPIDYYQKANSILDKQITEKGLEGDTIQKFKQYFDTRALALPSFNTLPKMLSEKGYVSFQGGKWWEFTYQNGGFTHGMTKGWTEAEQKTGNWFEKHMGGDGMDLARVTNQPAYDFLEETKGNPFFMWFAPSLPHYPFDAPEQYYNLYKDKEMTESAKQYYANCTWFDDAWGQMVNYLKKNDLYDNTLIIYVNDNGWEQTPEQEFSNDPMRSHNGGDKGKSSIYDMSFRSPIIFAWANEIGKGKRTNAIIHSADIPATILDYVGLDIPKDFYGMSYRSVIDNEKESLRTEVMGNVITTRDEGEKYIMGRPTEGYWIRENNWFLRWDITRGEQELFDINKDWNNDNNIAEENPKILKRLVEKVEDFKAQKGEDPRLDYYRKMKATEK